MSPWAVSLTSVATSEVRGGRFLSGGEGVDADFRRVETVAEHFPTGVDEKKMTQKGLELGPSGIFLLDPKICPPGARVGKMKAQMTADGDALGRVLGPRPISSRRFVAVASCTLCQANQCAQNQRRGRTLELQESRGALLFAFPDFFTLSNPSPQGSEISVMIIPPSGGTAVL